MRITKPMAPVKKPVEIKKAPVKVIEPIVELKAEEEIKEEEFDLDDIQI